MVLYLENWKLAAITAECIDKTQTQTELIEKYYIKTHATLAFRNISFTIDICDPNTSDCSGSSSDIWV